MKSIRSLLLPRTFQQCRNISVQSSLGLFSREFRNRVLSPPIKTNQDCKLLKITPTTIVRTMASDKPPNMVVVHDASAKKFFIQLDKDEAKLEYTKRGDTLNMWHTEVPPPLQGKGIAKVLAKGAFDHAVKNNLKMRLTCPYLQKFYAENPKDEYKLLVVAEK